MQSLIVSIITCTMITLFFTSTGQAVCYGFSGSINNSASVSITVSGSGSVNVPGRYSEGTVVIYSCKPHFAPLNGQNEARCTNDGTWQPVIPYCSSKQYHCDRFFERQ